jgi:hypothetical protein
MKRIKIPWILALFFVLGGGDISTAQHLVPPRSAGELKLSEKEESFETTRFRRLYFSGDLRMAGDPPPEFVSVDEAREGAAVMFRHKMVRDAVMRIWVYEDAGSFRFSDEVWNQQLSEWIETLPRRYSAKVEQRFRETENSGPPILGFVSIQALVTITDGETGKGQRQRFYLVPVEESGLVLLFSLSSGQERFSYFDSIFDNFVRRLYTLSPEER